MKNIVRNLLFLIFLCFSISYDCYTLGVNYDKKYKLYPELDFDSCEMCCTIPTDEVYGKRWERLGFTSFVLSSGLMLVTLFIWRRSKPVFDKKLSILQEKNNENWRDCT